MSRRKGSRNKGYYFRSGRGWFTTVDGKMVPLEYPDGRRMRGRATPETDVKAAYHRLMVNGNAPQSNGSVTVREVCQAYLDECKRVGAASTLEKRSGTLFDFCFGFPPKYMAWKTQPQEKHRIHPGYGRKRVGEIIPLDIKKWLQAHPNWKGSCRTHIQAVKRAFNYGVENKLIEANPIKGYKVEKQNARVTYITPEQEQALIDHANDSFAVALKVCIRTGARPGCEFAALESRHVRDHGERMEWIFPPEESKTGLLRTIRISDPEILKLVRERMKRKGPLFTNTQGGSWKRESLSQSFRDTKKRTGLEFDADCVMYSCRHTFAKRTLQGYWTGKITNIETLAQLMGNTPEVCRKHYLQWCDHYSEPLWDAV